MLDIAKIMKKGVENKQNFERGLKMENITENKIIIETENFNHFSNGKTMMKTQYLATWTANNGASYSSEPYYFTNKAKAIAFIKKVCAGNIFDNNCGSWHVTDNKNFEVQGTIYR